MPSNGRPTGVPGERDTSGLPTVAGIFEEVKLFAVIDEGLVYGSSFLEASWWAEATLEHISSTVLQ